MKIKVQDEVEFEGDYGLDVGREQEQESYGRIPHGDNALDKIRQVMQILQYKERKRKQLISITQVFKQVF
jgi:hypothetical protein